MMIRSSILALALGVSGLAFAEDKPAEPKKDEKKAAEGHCEKKGKDGKIEDVEAKDKAECKKLGGKWQKGAKGDHAHGG